MENDRLENRKLLEQELRSMTKKRRSDKTPLEPKKTKSIGKLDNYDRYDNSAAKSPYEEEKSNKLCDTGKKPVKERRSELPTIRKRMHFNESDDYWQKPEKISSVEVLTVQKRKHFNEPDDYWKETENTSSIESPTTLRKQQYWETYERRPSVESPADSREFYKYLKGFMKKRRSESPVISKESYGYLKECKKKRNAESPIASRSYEYPKKSKKKLYVKAPIDYEEPYDYLKKSRKKKHSGSPVAYEKKYEYLKKSKTKQDIESPISSDASSPEFYGRRKKSEKGCKSESPTYKIKKSDDLSDWGKKQHVVDLRTLIKGKTRGDLKYEKKLTVKKHRIVKSPSVSEENSSVELLDGSIKSQKISAIKKRRVASPAPSEGSSSVELIGELVKPEMKSTVPAMKKKQIYVNSPCCSASVSSTTNIDKFKSSLHNECGSSNSIYFDTAASPSANFEKFQSSERMECCSSENVYFNTPPSTSNNLDRFKSCSQHIECGSSARVYFNTPGSSGTNYIHKFQSLSANSSNFCENCKCIMKPNFSPLVSSNYSEPIISSRPDMTGCFLQNDINLYAANRIGEINRCCSITGSPLLPNQSQGAQNIRIVCTPSNSEALKLQGNYNYFQNRRPDSTPNEPEHAKFQEKYAYLKHKSMQKKFSSPYHYFAKKESLYKWKRPQNVSGAQWNQQPEVTKEELDNELEDYMSEVKATDLSKKDDVQPFVEEYMLEVEKTLNQNYTMDTFN